jgi:hypothetical protein
MKLEFIPISEIRDGDILNNISDDCIAILLHTVILDELETHFWIEVLPNGMYTTNGLTTIDFSYAKRNLLDQMVGCIPNLDLSNYPEFLPYEVTKYINSNESDCFYEFKDGLNKLGYTCTTLVGNRAKGLRELTPMEHTVFQMFGQLSSISTDFSISIHYKKNQSVCVPISKEVLTTLLKLIE